MSLILGILLYIFGRDAFHSALIASFIAIFGAILGLLCFANVAARISVENGEVRILRSFDDLVVPNASIRDWSVHTLSASRWIVVSIWRQEMQFPAMVHFVVADTTSAGDLNPTVAALKKLLSDVCP